MYNGCESVYNRTFFLMLGHRLRRWANIKKNLGQCHVMLNPLRSSDAKMRT